MTAHESGTPETDALVARHTNAMAMMPDYRTMAKARIDAALAAKEKT